MAEQRARAANLTAVLVTVALGELAIHRVADRLFAPVGAGMSALAGLGWFLFHLTGVLGVIVLLAGLVGALRRRELFPRPMRVAVLVIGGVFVILAALRVLMPARAGFLAHLYIGFAFLSFTIAAGLLGTGVSWRAKLGVVLMAFPGVLHAAAIISHAAAGELQGPLVSPLLLARMGEYMLLLAALASPFLLASPARPGARWRWSIVGAGIGALAVAVLLVAFTDAVQTVALYAVSLDVPSLPSVQGGIFVLAFGAWLASVLHLLGAPGGSRLAGYGMILMAIGGYQGAGALELVLAVTGLLALAMGELRAWSEPMEHAARRPSAVAPAAWQQTVAELTERLGVPGTPAECVEVDEDGQQLLRLRARHADLPLAVRIVRVRGAVAELDLRLGEPGHGEPDGALASRAARNARALQRSAGAVLPARPTGADVLDRAAAAYGRIPATTDELAARLAGLAGLVTLWNGRAVRFQAAFPSAEPDRDPFATDGEGKVGAARLVAMVEILAALLAASGSGHTAAAPASE